MTEEQALKESIEHWERMIKYVEDFRNYSDKPSRGVMGFAIGEDWFSEYCPLCQLHRRINQLPPIDCDSCTLGLHIGSCECPGSLWSRVNNALTWGEWVENANVFLNKLEELNAKEYGKEEKMEYPKLEIRDPAPEKEGGVIKVDAERLLDNVEKPLMLEQRSSGNFAGKAFWVNGGYDWVFGRDSDGELVVVPLKKVD